MRVSDDAQRLRALLELNAGDLLSYFLRRVQLADDAADLVSETMLTVWRRIGHLPQEDVRARMWMFGVARRVLANYQRGRRRQHALADRLREEIRTSPDHEPDRSELRAAIATLKPKHREVVMLVHAEGFSLAEVATMLRCSASTVRGRYSVALTQLRSALADDSLADSVPIGDRLAGADGR